MARRCSDLASGLRRKRPNASAPPPAMRFACKRRARSLTVEEWWRALHKLTTPVQNRRKKSCGSNANRNYILTKYIHIICIVICHVHVYIHTVYVFVCVYVLCISMAYIIFMYVYIYIQVCMCIYTRVYMCVCVFKSCYCKSQVKTKLLVSNYPYI